MTKQQFFWLGVAFGFLCGVVFVVSLCIGLSQPIPYDQSSILNEELGENMLHQ